MEKITTWLSGLSTTKAWTVGIVSVLSSTICIWLLGVTFLLSSGICNENLICVIFGGSFLFPFIICLLFVIWMGCINGCTNNQNNNYEPQHYGESLMEEDQEAFLQQAHELP